MNTYLLILEEDAVISVDIAETVKEFAPGLDIVVCRTLDEAVARAEAQPHVVAAIVNWPYAELVGSPLDALVSARGGRIVVTRGPGKHDDLIPEHWINLTVPFTTASLKSALD